MEQRKFYQNVRELILENLKSGALRPGDRLPSERGLCAATGMNRNTVRHALLVLQRQGRIFRLDRRGWFVNPVRLVYNPARHVNFAKLAASQGRTPEWTTEDKGVAVVDEQSGAAPPDGFALGTSVYEMENVFFLDGQKVACVENYLHAGRLSGIIPKIRKRAMTQVIEEEYGVALIQRDLLIRPQFLSDRACFQLDVPKGSPGMYIRRIKTDGAGDVLTVEREYWRFDAMELRVSLE